LDDRLDSANGLLLLPVQHLAPSAWKLAGSAFAIQVLAILFSLVGPVPINNRVAKWTPENLPADWQTQENHWDAYHWLRTIGLIAAFALLVLSVRVC
jgi:uncharacterized membrane protein